MWKDTLVLKYFDFFIKDSQINTISKALAQRFKFPVTVNLISYLQYSLNYYLLARN